ncbi:MAG: hypothetical protein R3B70_49410, partial [Polyangiaceae bacterium]
MARRATPAVLVLAALSALLTACGSGGGGDPPSEPAASVLGSGNRIADVVLDPTDPESGWYDVNNKDSINCGAPADKTVDVTGVTVTAIDRFDEVADGALGNVYVQDTTDEP